MQSILSAKSRICEPEIMDDPLLDGGRHEAALRGLSRLNYMSGIASTIWPPLAALARQLGRRQLRVLDVASGAGDVPLRLWHIARRSGLHLEILGLDVSPRAVEFAAGRVAKKLFQSRTCWDGSCTAIPCFPERGGSTTAAPTSGRAAAEQAAIQFSVLDVLAGPLPEGFDVVTCSLFLHHLAEDEGVLLLQAMAKATKHLVLVDDLRRSPAGLALAHLAAWALSGSDVVRVDGARSVRAAFTVREAAALARAAGLKGAIVQRHWPLRFLLSWQRS